MRENPCIEIKANFRSNLAYALCLQSLIPQLKGSDPSQHQMRGSPGNASHRTWHRLETIDKHCSPPSSLCDAVKTM